MKHLRIFAVLAIAAAALLAFAATTMATTITSPEGTAVTPMLHIVNENGHIKLNNPTANIECNMTAEGEIEQHGTGVTAKGSLSDLTINGCTNSWHATAVTTGEIEIHGTGESDGTLTLNGTKVDTTRFGVTCVYQATNTPLGTLTGGNPITLHVEASIPIVAAESSGLCGTGSSKMQGAISATAEAYIDQ